MKRVLVLGAGLVVKPLVDYLLARPDVELYLATLNIDRARRLVGGRPNAVALQINAADEAQLEPAVGRANCVISLLPADQHVRIARACIDARVPLITTSYVSPEMRALHERAMDRGVLLLSETGLDPGIDHMSAVETIREIERDGGRVTGFFSYCGALPAPESSANPWRYKFTWSPKGVVVAARNRVRYIEHGQVVERDFPDYFDDPRPVTIPGVGRLEGYPNRDSQHYMPLYGLSEADDFYRGTLRYRGWCRTWSALHRLNLLDSTPRDWTGVRWRDWIDAHLRKEKGGLVERVSRALQLDEDDDVIARLEWLGLLSDRLIGDTVATPVDILAQRLEQKLVYEPGERDMVVLEHHFVYEKAGGGKATRAIRLLKYGPAGDDSALAETVSLPAAIACGLLLDGRVDLAGVRIPTDPQLTQPILAELATRGIRLEEIDDANAYSSSPAGSGSSTTTASRTPRP